MRPTHSKEGGEVETSNPRREKIRARERMAGVRETQQIALEGKNLRILQTLSAVVGTL
jgi:hypothetical protein